MMDSFIFDFETLGTDVQKLPVLSIACYAFDTKRFKDNPYTMGEIIKDAKFMKFDVADQVKNYNRVIDPSTLEWWNSLGPEIVEANLKPTENDKPLVDLHNLIVAEYPANAYVYTRGNTFDPMIITALCKQLNMVEPYPWWKVRDMRSLIDGLTWGYDVNTSFIPDGVDEASLQLHDPRTDIALDIIRFQSIIQATT